MLGRTEEAVKRKARLERVSLRRNAETNVSESLLVDLHLPLCPMCARRYADLDSGICTPCHLDRIVAAHEHDKDVKARQQRLDVVRQQKSRQRICEACGQPFYPRKSSTDTVCRDCRGAR